MTITYIIASFFACLIIASAASLPTNHVPRQLDSECDHPVILDAGTNVFLDHSLHPSSAWRQLTLGAAKNIVDNDLKKRAMNASEQGTFVWMYVPTRSGRHNSHKDVARSQMTFRASKKLRSMYLAIMSSDSYSQAYLTKNVFRTEQHQSLTHGLMKILFSNVRTTK